MYYGDNGRPVLCALLALAAGIIIMASSVQDSHADDFVVDAQCVEGHWHVIIYDEAVRDDQISDGSADWREHLVSDVSIRTIESAGSSDAKSTFTTDSHGSYFLAPEYNTGWVWLSKPGYNDQKVRSSCGTAYDVFSYSEQFESYCYDYVSQAIPMTYLPAAAAGSVEFVMKYFDDQIMSRDDAIDRQTQEIQEILRRINHTAGGNATIIDATTSVLSNDTRDALCILHIEDATRTAYEVLGALHAQRSGILPDSGAATAVPVLLYDEARISDDSAVATYCTGDAFGTPEAAERIESGLGTLQALYKEIRRQIAEQQYWALMSQLPESPHIQQQSHQQSYYNYYDGRDFYHHDATSYDYYDRYDTTRNYDPEFHKDHEDHGHGDCVTFCDRDDYEPDWARYLDKYEAREACWDVEANPERIGTADWYWCKDLDRYLYRR